MVTTADCLFAAIVYVAFRTSHPDILTMYQALKKMEDNNIDITQLVMYNTNHCKQAELSTEKDVPHRDWRRERK